MLAASRNATGVKLNVSHAFLSEHTLAYKRRVTPPAINLLLDKTMAKQCLMDWMFGAAWNIPSEDSSLRVNHTMPDRQRLRLENTLNDTLSICNSLSTNVRLEAYNSVGLQALRLQAKPRQHLLKHRNEDDSNPSHNHGTLRSMCLQTN